MPYKFKTTENYLTKIIITAETGRTVILRYGNLLSNITTTIIKIYIFILIYLATLSVPRLKMNTEYWRDKN